MEGQQKFQGGGGSQTLKFLKESMGLNRKFLWEEYGYFLEQLIINSDYMSD